MLKHLLTVAVFAYPICLATQANPHIALEQAKLPEGLVLELFDADVPQARSIAVSEAGHIAVGSTQRTVFLFQDIKGDASTFKRFLLPGLTNPNGVTWVGDDLLVAETTRVLYVKTPFEALANKRKPDMQVIIDGFINSRHHGRRFIDVGPDNRLYIALGTPCNICEPPDPDLSSTIRSYDLASFTGTTYAFGLRNSVGFDWHPTTGEMWATDNGRDWLGDDLPHDELNRIYQPGLHFGFPYCHANNLADPEYGDQRPCTDFETNTLGLGPHVASLGIHFLRTANILPVGTALIALHGSWNRSEPIGYAVMLVGFSADGYKVISYTPFISGWLSPTGTVYARPVDIAELSDGSLLVSDDVNGALYRVIKAAL